jgi:FKBP-type peptidyl-prolyl cis-trans isomerase
LKAANNLCIKHFVPQSRHRKINKARKRPRVAAANPMVTTRPAGNRNLRIGAIILVAVIAVAAIAYLVNRGGDSSQAISEVTTPSGLKIEELKLGDGATPNPGQTITVHYIGKLANGTEFNNSYKGGAPIDFRIGVGAVIKGWDEGLMSMKVGGKRRLSIPSKLAYGPQGRPPAIPPNSDLVFEIELLGIK